MGPAVADGGPGLPPGWLRPRFSAPRVVALMTGRAGGASTGAFAGMNLRGGLGDEPAAVQHNRECLQAWLGMPTVPLQQVHGVRVVSVAAALRGAAPETADASVSTLPGLACEIQVADCLPVLLADVHGRGVAAAHAGWRGLAGGVLEATLALLCRSADVVPQDVEAWLGPCIGPQAFEVGADVLAAFAADPRQPGVHFQSRGGDKWLASLPGLARDRLAQAGLARIDGNDATARWCTWSNPDRYFSFRRERITGRMAACIGLIDAGPPNRPAGPG
jgi:YfiH family protein